MAQLKRKDLEEFVQILLQKLKDEFSVHYLSGNLLNTITVDNSNPDLIRIEIPAETYNMLLYQTRGVVVPYQSKSYAMKLNEQGSSFKLYPNGTVKGSYWIHPGNHKGYLDKVINEAISEWTQLKSKDWTLENITKS